MTQKSPTQKSLKKAQQKEANSAGLGAVELGKIAGEIASSPIDDAHKAMFLYTIAQGTFNLKLYERYQELLSAYRQQLLAEAEQVQQQLDQLERQYEATTKELSQAAVGACEEIKAACDHIEQQAVKHIEATKTSGEKKEVEKIRENLKKK